MLVMPDPTTAVIDPFMTHADAVADLQHRRPDHQGRRTRATRATSPQGREVPEVDRHRRHRRTSAPSPSSSSSTTSASIRRPEQRLLHRRLGRRPLEHAAATRGPNLGYKPRYKEGYFPVPPTDTLHDLRTEMVLTMEAVGIRVEVHHHEVATARPVRDRHAFNPLVKMADRTHVVQVHRQERRPQARQDGDVHAEAALRRQRLGHALPPVDLEGREAALRRRRLRRPDASWRCTTSAASSSTRRRSCAFTNPTHEQLPAPGAGLRGAGEPGVLAAQPLGRRSASRCTAPSPKAKRIEFRCPDPTCNPYLAFAAMLMAGLDGIQNKIDPGEPLDKDIYALSPEELKDVPKTPGSLDEALDDLEKRPRVPAQGRRLHRGRDRDLDRLQARERGRRDPAAPAPVRVRAVLRQLVDSEPADRFRTSGRPELERPTDPADRSASQPWEGGPFAFDGALRG